MIGVSLTNKIPVELTEEEAILFTSFRKYQDVFGLLLKSGVFETHNGTVVLYFNTQGQIRKIDRNQALFVFGV